MILPDTSFKLFTAFSLRFLLPSMLLAMTADVAAQGRGGAELRPVHVVFSAVGFDDSDQAVKDFVFFGTGQQQDGGEDLSVPAFRRSMMYKYDGSPSLVFYGRDELRRAREATGEGVLPEVSPAGSVRLPTGTDRLMLLFIPLGEGKYRIVALDDSESNFPAGSARVFNATGRQLALKVMNRAPELVGVGESVIAEGNGFNIRMQVGWNRDGQWEIVASPMFDLRKAQRRTIFLTFSDSDFFKVETVEGTLLDRGPIQVFSVTD